MQKEKPVNMENYKDETNVLNKHLESIGRKLYWVFFKDPVITSDSHQPEAVQPEAVKYCSKCGRKNEGRAIFCAACGSKLLQTSEQ